MTFGWTTSTAFYRGVYNSAWIGAQVTLLTSIFLFLLGFYVVNDSLKHDEKTRVGQIIATTPVGNPVYILGTMLSNFAVLASMVVIIMLTAIGMQIVRGENLAIIPRPLLAPFIIIVLPIISIVAAIAVLFETIPMLQKRAGNILYVFFWLIGTPIVADRIDLFGISLIKSSIVTTGLAEYPDIARSSFTLGFNTGLSPEQTLNTFTWSGVNWTLEVLQTRILLIGFALVVSLVAAWRFNRFDPVSDLLKLSNGVQTEVFRVEDFYEPSFKPNQNIKIRPLDENAISYGFLSMFLAEIKLVLNEFPSIGKLWVIVAVAFIAAGGLLLQHIARNIVLPVAWFLPVLYWSKLGTYEARYGTNQLVFSSAFIFKRQLLAIWLTGVFISMITGLGVAVNFGIHGNLSGLIAWSVGAVFIPSMALCLGVWTGSGKVFEFLYTLLWYIGPMSGVNLLDFMGVSPVSVEAGVWRLYLVATVLCIGLSYIGRKLQIMND